MVVFDSGVQLERITAAIYSNRFNSTDDENLGDDRSENKDPEPAAVTLGVVGDSPTSSPLLLIGNEVSGSLTVWVISEK